MRNLPFLVAAFVGLLAIPCRADAPPARLGTSAWDQDTGRALASLRKADDHRRAMAPFIELLQNARLYGEPEMARLLRVGVPEIGVQISVSADYVNGPDKAPQKAASVLYVMKGSPAAEAGIASGDEVLAVDGHRIGEVMRGPLPFDPEPFYRFVEAGPKAEVTLTLARGDSHLTVTLKKRPLPGPDAATLAACDKAEKAYAASVEEYLRLAHDPGADPQSLYQQYMDNVIGPNYDDCVKPLYNELFIGANER